MPDWPVSLPQDQFLGMTEQRQEARLRTQMDSGRPKTRRRFTAAITRYQVPIVLTGAQKQTFDTFFKTTLLEGSLPFTWEDPTTDVPADFLFVEPTQWRLEVGGSPNSRLWAGTLALEKLP